MKRTVQFAETDMAGVLHFANYYRMMEEVEHAFWRSRSAHVITRSGDIEVSWPRVATSCEYFTPARFEDELELVFSVAHVGERSAVYQVEFMRGVDRIATGRTTAVCCALGPDGFRPIAIPDELRKKLITSKREETAVPPSTES